MVTHNLLPSELKFRVFIDISLLNKNKILLTESELRVWLKIKRKYLDYTHKLGYLEGEGEGETSRFNQSLGKVKMIKAESLLDKKYRYDEIDKARK